MPDNRSRGYLMLLIFLTTATALLALCITTDRPAGGSNVTTTRTDGSTREGCIDVTGGRVWFRIVGADRPGTPLLVLHGGPGATHDYLEPLAALAAERPIVFYDQLGCGNSDRPDDPALWTVERYVGEVGEVREALGLSRVHLLGQSWGGGLAAEYVLSAESGGIESLVLSAPLLDADRWVADQRANLAAFPDGTQEDIREAEASGNFDSPEYQDAMAAYYARHVCRMDPWPECLNRTFEKISLPVYLQMWGPSEFTCTGTLREFSVTGRLADVGVPVLFTCGEHDEASPATMAYFRSQVPGSELKVFNGASHEHHLEETDAYLATVREFLSRVDAAR
jgi:proline iminopeptidase